MPLAVPTSPRTQKLSWKKIYSETELYKAAVRLYTKPLFSWRKALFQSTDNKDFYDFARHGLKNLQELHRQLQQEEFEFRPAVALHKKFRGKRRTLYVYPWEERLVDLLLYRLLNEKLQSWFSKNSYAYRLRGFGLDRCQRRINTVLKEAKKPIYAVKRDIANYFPSVPHGQLLEQLGTIIDRNDFLFELLEQRVRFRYEDAGELRSSGRGIAFGTASACLLANIYLTPLDRVFDTMPGVNYFRYADDFLFLCESAETAKRVSVEFEDGLTRLELGSKKTHELNLLLTNGKESEQNFERVTGIRHLGLCFQANGEVRLSRDKARKICNVFRYAFRRKRAKLARILERRKRAEFLVETAKKALEQSVRNVAIIDYYLKHVTDEGQLRMLDRWLAEEVLSLTMDGGHKKKYFQEIPFQALRAMGLPSLVQRRREIRHGHIESSFFVWKKYQTQKSSRETAARPRAPKTAQAAFSPSPEAVTNTSEEDLVGERGHL